MTQEEILYQHYLMITTKSRNEAIELLKKRDFSSLNRNYIHWFDKKEKNITLTSTKISDVIKELSNVKLKDNESEPHLSSWFESNTDEGSIEITSYLYYIVPFEKCESMAKHNTSNSLWKLKHQPNGNDAEATRKILEKYK
jgi:hypothetical protein